MSNRNVLGSYIPDYPTVRVAENILPKNTDHQLVIIGNGFDISCGLRSRFSDFFIQRVEKLEEAKKYKGEELVAFCAANDLTAWDLILASRRGIPGGYMQANWSNVESAIATVVLDLDAELEEINPEFQVVTSYLLSNYLNALAIMEGKEDQAEPIGGFRFSSLFDRTLTPSLESYGEDIARVAHYLKAAYPSIEWDKQTVLQALLEELHALEDSFRDHMIAVVGESQAYGEQSAELLRRLIDFEVPEKSSALFQTTILDFNYTSPVIPSATRSTVVDFFNVHGKLDGEIIFGIDGTGHMGDPESIQFTKTYRLLGLRSVRSSRPIAYGHDALLNVGKKKTVAIKFYGHSLAAADYSYFQSIFDMVSLYDSNVKLYFFFSDYKKGAEDTMFLAVTSLLSAYGETMDNKDHGRNLIHKLILEGRLAVVEI